MTNDAKIVARVVSRFSAAQKKLSPTQLEVLEHPDRLRTKTQYQAADKLVEMGLLEKVPLARPNAFYYKPTPEGFKYLRTIEDAKDNLTSENIYEIARKFPDFVGPRVDVDRLAITLVIRDPAHGNTVVRTVTKVPSDKDIEKIVNDMMGDLKHRALQTRERWKYIPR